MKRECVKDRYPIDKQTALVQPADLIHRACMLAHNTRKFESFEHAYRVGPNRDRRADIEERRRLFVNFRLESKFSQGESSS